MNKYSIDDLKKMTAEARATLYQNAMKLRGAGG